MSDIRKQIKLVATLDDAGFKRQLEQFKKSLGKDLAFDPQALTGLKDVFKDIAKEFSAELKKAVEAVKSSTNKSGGSRGGKDSTFFPQTGKYIPSGSESNYSLEYNKLFKNEKDRISFSEFQKQKSNKKLLEVDHREKEKFAQQEEKARLSSLQKESKLKEKDLIKQERLRADIRDQRANKIGDQNDRFASLRGRLQSHIAGKLGAPNISDYAETPSDFAGAMGKFGGSSGIGSLLSGKGRFLGAGAAGLAINKIASEYGNMRELYAQRAQGQGLETLAGQGLSGAIGGGARGLNTRSALQGTGTALEYGAIGAGVGSFLGPVGTVIGGIVGGVYGGIKGYAKGGEEEAETRKKESQLALVGLQKAKDLREARIQAMSGGGVNGPGLNMLQQRGASQFGFNPEETLQQFNQAKQFLGNKGAKQNLGTFQEMNRRFGVDTGEQARSAEIFAGGERTNVAAGSQQVVEVLKRGVSSGLDASKSSQFLKATADYIQNTTGFGRIDTDAISEKLAQNAFGFAGGGTVNQTQIDQAKSLLELTKQESTSKSGFAGLGNIAGIQSAFNDSGQKLDTGTFIALQNLSSNARKDDIQDILRKGGVSEDVIDSLTGKIQNVKQNAADQGAALTGITGNLKTGLLSEERGISTEQQQGLDFAKNFQGPMPAGTAPEMVGGTEMQSKIAEATANQKAFVEGLGLLAKDTEAVSSNMKELTTQLKNAAEAAKGFADSGIRRSTQ